MVCASGVSAWRLCGVIVWIGTHSLHRFPSGQKPVVVMVIDVKCAPNSNGIDGGSQISPRSRSITVAVQQLRSRKGGNEVVRVLEGRECGSKGKEGMWLGRECKKGRDEPSSPRTPRWRGPRRHWRHTPPPIAAGPEPWCMASSRLVCVRAYLCAVLLFVLISLIFMIHGDRDGCRTFGNTRVIQHPEVAIRAPLGRFNGKAQLHHSSRVL